MRNATGEAHALITSRRSPRAAADRPDMASGGRIEDGGRAFSRGRAAPVTVLPGQGCSARGVGARTPIRNPSPVCLHRGPEPGMKCR